MQTIAANENLAISTPGIAVAPSVGLRVEGRIARLKLGGGPNGHFLSQSTISTLREVLAALQAERTVELIVLEGEAGVFSSGPDLAGLYKSRTDGTDAAREFARASSKLVLEIARHAKPVLALMDGVVVGGGLAIGGHATYRVVTERTRIALPQTAVGLVPDLGLSRLLARAPVSLGPYLCLTGAGIGAADAIHAGFADGMIHSDRLEALCEKLANPFAGAMETILNSFATDPGQPPLLALSPGVTSAFANSSAAAIAAALAELQEPQAKQALTAIASGSPVAMQLALALIRQAGETRYLEDCLRAEHHFICKLLDCGEAYQGIGSRLVEAGRLPAWLAARVEDVTADLLSPFLTPLLPCDGLPPAQALDS